VGDGALAADPVDTGGGFGDRRQRFRRDRRVRPEHVNRDLRVVLEHGQGRFRQHVAGGEQDRVAGAGGPGGGRHRKLGLVGGGDEDVGGGGAEEVVAQLRDR